MNIGKMLQSARINGDLEDIEFAPMDLDKDERRYTLINELNSNNEEQLKAKYGESKEKAEEFIEIINEVGVFYTVYPFTMFEHFPTFANVVNYLDEKYNIGEDARKTSTYLNTQLGMVLRNSKHYHKNDADGVFILDQLAIKMGRGGEFQTHKFENLNRILANGTKKINAALKKNPVLPDKGKYEYDVLRPALDTKMDGFDEEAEKIVEEYKEQYPVITLMHDPDVLSTLNSIIGSTDDPNREAAEKLALTLIDYSHYFAAPKDFDERLYDSIARTTTKHVKNNHKEQKGRARVFRRNNKASV